MRSEPPSARNICCKLHGIGISSPPIQGIAMRICVAHETVYRYETPCSGVIQTLRLTPRNHTGQYVVDWRIDISADCRLEPQEDAFGNLTHAFSAAGPVSDLRLMVEGEVETQDTAGIVRGAVERFPPSLFLRETVLTCPDAALTAYAAEFEHPDGGTLDMLHSLLVRLHEDVTCDPDAPGAGSSAAEAFACKRANCRDLSHIFITLARLRGVPARYVAGYFRRDEGAAGPEIGHAWVEAHVPGLGWVGFDPANEICVTDQHIRVAIGLDHQGAAPVRGAHYGGGREEQAVKLVVAQAAWQTQG
jgi:transglutaminase-like putative cysteine protease